ncbi:hypothetical protein ACWDUX_30080 [Streptomyces sp. NPDC003444]
MKVEFGGWGCSTNRSVRVEAMDELITFDVSYTPPDEEQQYIYANITVREAKKLRKALRAAIRKAAGGKY